MLRQLATPVVIVMLAGSLVGSAAGECPRGDLDGDCRVFWTDLEAFAGRWLDPWCYSNDCQADLDDVPGVNMPDFAVIAGNWLKEYREYVHIKWLGHASFKIWKADLVIYVDPRNLGESPPDATVVLVSHSHGDHYSPADIARISGPQTELIAPPDVIANAGHGRTIAPGQTIELQGVRIKGVAAYNPAKQYHPKQNNWVGFIVEFGSTRIYYAGDTDLTDEMKALRDIDVALLPVGGTYTMNSQEAADATTYIEPDVAVPCHWGDVIGTRSDAETFALLAECDVRILDIGQFISSEGWLQDFPLIAHWQLDETDGPVAHDSAGANSALVHGQPLWRPADGKVAGALELDGTDDYIATGFILNPADGPFSIFAWIKGGAPGQVIVSQLAGRSWLRPDPTAGKLMTELKAPGRFGYALYSEAIITDALWHRIGLVWDGTSRYLYVDDAEVSRDTAPVTTLESADGGLYIGAAAVLDESGFFAGLIDDVRIYNTAIMP
jgi:L-ascorbate metabolism protein UlaG (beta-lactamase superfamily)